MSAGDTETPSADDFIARRKAAIEKGVWARAKDILQGGTHRYRVEQGTYQPQSNNPLKVLAIERLRWERFVETTPGAAPRRERSPDEVAYRIGYWVVSRRERWWWGQFAAMIPEDDLEPLLERAREEGTILPRNALPDSPS